MKISNTYVSRPWLSIQPQTDGLLLFYMMMHSFDLSGHNRGIMPSLSPILWTARIFVQVASHQRVEPDGKKMDALLVL